MQHSYKESHKKLINKKTMISYMKTMKLKKKDEHENLWTWGRSSLNYESFMIHERGFKFELGKRLMEWTPTAPLGELLME